MVKDEKWLIQWSEMTEYLEKLTKQYYVIHYFPQNIRKVKCIDTHSNEAENADFSKT